jgi:hypothetical protein
MMALTGLGVKPLDVGAVADLERYGAGGPAMLGFSHGHDPRSRSDFSPGIAVGISAIIVI